MGAANSSETGRVIKIEVRDATKAKDFYVDYLMDKGAAAEMYHEEAMMLDGVRKCVYILFRRQKDAEDFCRRRHKDDNIESVSMATEDEWPLHNNLVFVRNDVQDFSSAKIRSNVKTEIEKTTGHLLTDFIQQDDSNSIIFCLDKDSSSSVVSDVLWKCRRLFRTTTTVVAPVTVTNTVLVRGLRADITDDEFRRYMQNQRRSGGGQVQDIDRFGLNAVVKFCSTESSDSVLAKTDHELDDSRLTVSKFYPCLSLRYGSQSRVAQESTRRGADGQDTPASRQW